MRFAFIKTSKTRWYNFERLLKIGRFQLFSTSVHPWSISSSRFAWWLVWNLESENRSEGVFENLTIVHSSFTVDVPSFNSQLLLLENWKSTCMIIDRNHWSIILSLCTVSSYFLIVDESPIFSSQTPVNVRWLFSLKLLCLLLWDH